MSVIDLTTFFNTPGITHIISDYEGEKIPDISENLLICGDIIDSTVGGGGDSTQMPVNGLVGGISKNFNLYNIHQVLTKPNIRLILGNRDLNKIKCLPLCKMKYMKKKYEIKEAENIKDEIIKEKDNIQKFNNGNINLSTDTYEKYKAIIKKNDWLANMNNWLPFWNKSVFEKIIKTKEKDQSGLEKEVEKPNPNYNTWRDTYDVTKSTIPFLDRFNKIFGADGSIGTMSAGNLLFTIPFEVFGVDNLNKYITEQKITNKDDYLAFIVLSVFNAGFNKNDKSDKSDKTYQTIKQDDYLHNTYINGLLYKFYKAIGKEKINFMGYYNLADKLYVFSHGGITSDLIETPSINDLQDQIIKDYDKITNSEEAFQPSQTGGAINVTKSFTKDTITKSLDTYNQNVCKIVQKFMDDFYQCIEDQYTTTFTDLSVYTYKPSKDMLLLLSLSAPYRPDRPEDVKDMFVTRSPINPGIVEITKKGFVCKDTQLTQIFGHVPKGFGPTFFTLKMGDKKSYLANIDMSQSFKYSGWAGTTNVKIIFTRSKNEFTLHYDLDISNDTKIKKSEKTSITNIVWKDDNGKYILKNIDELGDKKLTITQTLDEIFTNEEKIKTELKDIIGSNFILYHGYNQTNQAHVFTLSDSITSYNKVLVLYKSTESQAGGYYEKYMKYKSKYLKLKQSII